MRFISCITQEAALGAGRLPQAESLFAELHDLLVAEGARKRKRAPRETLRRESPFLKKIILHAPLNMKGKKYVLVALHKTLHPAPKKKHN